MRIAVLPGDGIGPVDKANVLEVSQLWRAVMTRVGAQHPVPAGDGAGGNGGNGRCCGRGLEVFGEMTADRRFRIRLATRLRPIERLRGVADGARKRMTWT
jgi:hypothetical protein